MGNRVQETDADGNTRTTTWLEHRAPLGHYRSRRQRHRFWYDNTTG